MERSKYTPEEAGLRLDAADAVRRNNLSGYAGLCGLIADLYDDRAAAAYGVEADRLAGIAERRRVKGGRVRVPGLLWPKLKHGEGGLSRHQLGQLGVATSRAVGILCGVPGCGKTHSAAVLIKRCVERWGAELVGVAAPTGKAAVRITEALRSRDVDIRATTIHQLLEIGRNGHDGDGWDFRRNETRKLPHRFLFVEEASMLDTDLAASLLRAIAPGTHVLFIGDPNQLPPVSHGATLRDMIASGKIAVGSLTEIWRNDGGIVEACRQIRQGQRFDVGGNLLHVAVKSAATAVDLAWPIMCQRYREHCDGGNVITDTQWICATNKGELGRIELNRRLQELYNPNGGRAEGNPFRLRDKVICLRNGLYPYCDVEELAPNGEDVHAPPLQMIRGLAHYLANGEMGTVVGVSPTDTTMVFDGPRRYVAIPNDPPRKGPGVKAREDDFALGYAGTCHKMQGSEWPIVVVVIDPSENAKGVCGREWIYTAISRASKYCIIAGDLGVARMMPRRPSLDYRKTRLVELLSEVPK